MTATVYYEADADRSLIVALSEPWLGKILDPAAPKIDGGKEIDLAVATVSSLNLGN